MAHGAFAHAQVVCSSRDLFGSDRSALRLIDVLRCLGVPDAGLVVPGQRPDRGLDGRAAELGIPVTRRTVAISSSKGLDGLRGLVSEPADADLAIYNTSAIVRGKGADRVRVLILREWISARRPEQQLLMRLHGRRVDGLVAVSTGVLGQVDHLLPAHVERAVIPNWLDEVRPAAGAAASEREGIVCVARFNQWKGQEALASAWERAFAGMSDPPTLTFVGAEDPPSPFARRAESLRARARGRPWRVLPYTSDVDSVLDESALLVVPSERPEPFGNVIIEALNAGCQVLAFAGAGPNDLARTFPSVVRVVPRSPGSLARGLHDWYVRSSEPFPIAADEIRATLLARYSHEAAVAAWRELLDRIVRRRASPRR